MAHWACLGWLFFQGTLQSSLVVEGGLRRLLRHKLVLVQSPVPRNFCKQGCGSGWVTHTLWPNQNLKPLILWFFHLFTLKMFKVVTRTAIRCHNCLTFQVLVLEKGVTCTLKLLSFREWSQGFTSCKSRCWKDIWLPCMCIPIFKIKLSFTKGLSMSETRDKKESGELLVI